MDTNKVILEVIKAVIAGKGVDEKIAVLEAIIAENRHASESEIEILESATGKPKKKKEKIEVAEVPTEELEEKKE